MKKQSWYKLLIIQIVLLSFMSCSHDTTSVNEIELWPEIEPFHSEYLKVSDIHEIYYEICGNPNGIPVFVIHGGPGLGCSPYYRRFFNPEKYLIILHDQRGCGKSRPNAELRENTTDNLIADIEQLRKKLNLDKIILFGGSWGSTLSLTYAESYPDNVKGLVLRGIFLGTQGLEDTYKRLSKFYPKLYDSIVNVLPDTISELSAKICYKLVTSEKQADRIKYAKLISRYEFKASGLHIEDKILDYFYSSDENLEKIYTMALLEYHYLNNECFLEEGQLLKDAYKIQDIPTILVNGRYDMVCPPHNAYKLHKKLPNSKIIIVENAGHSMDEKPIEKELILIMNKLENI